MKPDLIPSTLSGDALRASEQKYRELVERATDLVYSFDSKGQMISVNAAVERIFGYTVEEALASSVFRIVHPDDMPIAMAHNLAKIEGREDESIYTLRGLRKDGTTVWVEISSNALRRDGKLVSIQGIIRDISERRAAQDALQASEERYRELLDNANDVIYTHDLRGRFTSANSACKRVFGYDPAEFLHLSIQDIVHPDHLAKARANMAAKVDGGLERTPPYELLARGKDREVWIEVSTRAMLDAQGHPYAIQGIARDVSRRKAAEAKHRNLFEGVPVGLFRTAPDGAILDANQAMVRIVAAPSLDALKQLNSRDLYDDSSTRADVLSRIDAAGSQSFKVRMKRMDGSHAWVRGTSQAVRGADGKVECYEGHLEDITDQENAEAGIRLVNQLALELNQCPDSSTAMSLTLRRVCEVTGWSYGEAWVPTEDTLVCHDAWYTSAPDRVRKFRHLSKRMDFRRGETVMGMMWEHPTTLWRPDLDDEPWFSRASAAKAAGFQSLVAIPVKADHVVVALLVFLHDHSQPDDWRWVQVAESTANQLGALLGRLLAEDRLRLQGALLEAHLEAAEEGVLAISQQGAILACNTRLLEMCGVKYTGSEPPARMRGQGLLDHLDNPKKFQRNVRTLYEERAAGKDEVMMEGRTYHRSQAPVSDVDELPLGRVYHFRAV